MDFIVVVTGLDELKLFVLIDTEENNYQNDIFFLLRYFLV